MAQAEAEVPNFRTKIRPLLIAGVALFIFIEIVALSPSQLEQSRDTTSIPPEVLINDSGFGLATGIPRDRVPDYSIDQFHYVSISNGEKQWKLVAEKAFMYNKEKLVHAVNVTASLFDDDKITVVKGKEAKYFMDQKDLELFGSVAAKFPDGFESFSEYMRYQPEQRKVQVPTTHAVEGRGAEEEGQILSFKSFGMDFSMASSEVILPKSAHVVMARRKPKDATTAGVADQTVIESDHCVIDRVNRIAHFTMDEKKPLDIRFVHITQPTLFAKSRKADLNYGDFSELLQYLVATEDVFIKETGEKADSLRYATGGRADFDTRRDVVVLKEFPQVYENNDTVTGDVIILHRDTDIVEVEHSNAFSEGE